MTTARRRFHARRNGFGSYTTVSPALRPGQARFYFTRVQNIMV